jgi:hypothetical protein
VVDCGPLRLTCQVRLVGPDQARVSTDPLNDAFDRLDDFVAVQRAAGGITVDTVRLLQEAVGLEDRERAAIGVRVEALAPAHPGSVLIGIVLGLLAAQLDGGGGDGPRRRSRRSQQSPSGEFDSEDLEYEAN